MQNLFLKLLVLASVIGGSCIVVWKAHQELQSRNPQSVAQEFQAVSDDLQLGAPSAATPPTPNVAAAPPRFELEHAGTEPSMASSIPRQVPELAPGDEILNPIAEQGASPEPTPAGNVLLSPTPDPPVASSRPRLFFAGPGRSSNGGSTDPGARLAPSDDVSPTPAHGEPTLASPEPLTTAPPGGSPPSSDPFLSSTVPADSPFGRAHRDEQSNLTSSEQRTTVPTVRGNLSGDSSPHVPTLSPQPDPLPQSGVASDPTTPAANNGRPTVPPWMLESAAPQRAVTTKPRSLEDSPPTGGPHSQPAPAVPTLPSLEPSPTIAPPQSAAAGAAHPAAQDPFAGAATLPAQQPPRELRPSSPALLPPGQSELPSLPVNGNDEILPTLSPPTNASDRTPAADSDAQASPPRGNPFSSGAGPVNPPSDLPRIVPNEPRSTPSIPNWNLNSSRPAGPEARTTGPTSSPSAASSDPQPSLARPSLLPDPIGQRTPAPTIPVPAQEPALTPQHLIGTGDVDAQTPSGPQSPELKIEKIAPPEAVIGEPLIYAIKIRNVGGSEARDVIVEDRIPRGAQLEGTIPQAYLDEGKLIWKLGTMGPGAEQKIQLKVIPLEEGQIGSVATVKFTAAVATRIRVTAPVLTISIDGPTEATVGEHLAYRFTLRNTGEGNAKSVYLRALLPPELEHPGGQDLEYEVGALAAGAQKTVELKLAAVKPGTATPRALVSNDGKTHNEARTDVRIIPNRIHLEYAGPTARFVGRSGAFVAKVTNESSDVLQNVTVQQRVPLGIEMAGLPTGRWDPRSRVISWTIPKLAPGESQELASQLVASSSGEFAVTLAAADQTGNRTELKTSLDVKGFADLELDVSSRQRMAVVGDQVSLRLTVKNGGTAPARDVRVRFEVPHGLEFTAANPSTYRQVDGNVVEFESISEIPVNSQKSFDVVFIASQPGPAKVSVQLACADYDQPLVRDQAIRVIGDGRQ